MQLSFTRLAIDSRMASTMLEFYQKAVGMEILRQFKTTTDHVIWLGFANNLKSSGMELHIKQNPTNLPYERNPSTESYWKIGLALQDVNMGRTLLHQRGVSVTNPSQFRDVGYLCHLADPQGFQIELLQHTFQQNAQPLTSPDPQLPLGQSTNVGQITLRVQNIQKTLDFYTNVLGMKVLTREAVAPHFNLYFIALTTETPPNSNLDAVENREWLYQRPYTTLELMDDFNSNTRYQSLSPSDTEEQVGFLGITCEVSTIAGWNAFIERLNTYNVEFQILSTELHSGVPSIQIQDPDGVVLTFLQILDKK